MVSRIAKRISVLFSKTLAYNTLNLITCMHQEKISKLCGDPRGKYWGNNTNRIYI